MNKMANIASIQEARFRSLEEASVAEVCNTAKKLREAKIQYMNTIRSLNTAYVNMLGPSNRIAHNEALQQAKDTYFAAKQAILQG